MIFRLVGRLLVVAFGFMVGLLVAFLLLTYLGGQLIFLELARQYGDNLPSSFVDILGVIGFFIELYPAITILPPILMVAIGEIGRFRSWLFYVLMGGWAALLVPLLYIAVKEGQAELPSAQFLAIFATAGFGGGLVYWLIAGRKA